MDDGPPAGGGVLLHVVGEDRGARVLHEERGGVLLKHHAHIEVKLAHVLGDVRPRVDDDEELLTVLGPDLVDEGLVGGHPAGLSTPPVDRLIQEHALADIPILVLSLLDLAEDVRLRVLVHVRHAGAARVARREGGREVLGLDVEHGPLRPGGQGQLGLLLKVGVELIPVAAVPVQDDDTEGARELQNLRPLRGLARLAVLVVVGPEIGDGGVVALAGLEGGDGLAEGVDSEGEGVGRL